MDNHEQDKIFVKYKPKLDKFIGLQFDYSKTIELFEIAIVEARASERAKFQTLLERVLSESEYANPNNDKAWLDSTAELIYRTNAGDLDDLYVPYVEGRKAALKALKQELEKVD